MATLSLAALCDGYDAWEASGKVVGIAGVPSDLFGKISILFKYLSCWHFHRTEQIKYCIANISYFPGILYE